MTSPAEEQRGAELKTFAAFAITGGIAASVNVAVRYVLSHWLIFEAAVTLAYLVGMTTAFLLSRRFVFRSARKAWMAEYARFALVNVVAFAQVLAVSELLVRIVFPMTGFTWRPEELGHLIGVASPIVTSYYAHKHFSFGRKTTEPRV